MSGISTRLCASGCGRVADLHHALDDGAGGLWRFECAAALCQDVRRLQSLKPGELTIIADMLRMCGALALARASLVALPLDRPDGTTLERLTNE